MRFRHVAGAAMCAAGLIVALWAYRQPLGLSAEEPAPGPVTPPAVLITHQPPARVAPKPTTRPTGVAVAIAKELTPDQAYTAAMLIMRCEAVAVPIGPQFHRTAEQVLQQKLSSVEGLNCEAMNARYSTYELAKYAAEGGNADAQLYFPVLASSVFDDPLAALDEDLVVDYKRSSMRFLSDAWRQGKVDALLSLSESYEVGRYAAKDPVLAYAYASLYARHSSSPWANEHVVSLGTTLSPAQIVRAREIARGLSN